MRLFISLFLALTAAIASPATAGDGTCDDLWFTRNALFAEAGYCFGSPLGEATFGNAGCTTKSPTLTGAQKARLERIKANEEGCHIDTERQRLDLKDLSIRLRLTDQPIRGLGESACLGWTRAPLVLRAGHALSAPTIGEIGTGDDVLFSHDSEAAEGRPWDYVQIFRDGAFKTAGWVVIDWGSETCTNLAG